MLARFLITAAVAALLTGPVLAQQAAKPKADVGEVATNQLAFLQADEIQDSVVRTGQGDEIGRIENLVVDVKKGDIAFAVIGVGGFLGVGDKAVAVPWSRLRPGGEPKSFVLDVDKDTLRNAPSFDAEAVTAAQAQQVRQQVAGFWQDVPRQGERAKPR